ncbi:MAG: glycosyl hydrolase family 4 [Candidatus Marinimicrobia bacterium]|nr:glycosyl hydrolase family 4 [Candidatus Neomarinimicrobiota bacterium]
MNKRIVLIGAGSTNFGLGTVSDIFNSEIFRGSTIVLHDINEKALLQTEKISQLFREKHNINIKIEANSSRKEALRGADYCIISIEVGDRFELWEQDWKIPQQFGIKQVFGENGGPGGMFHSMRIIPPILDICEDISRICPNAIIFSYSNPMQRICHTVTTKYPDLNFTGLCHEIASMERHLPEILNTPFSNIEIKAGGLNHFSILVEANYKDNGKDAYPKIREKVPEYFKNYINSWDGLDFKPGAERGLFFELFNRYNYLPITTDSHLGEYLQWAYSVVDHEGILDFYNKYKKKCLTYYSKETYGDYFKINGNMRERIVPILEGIATDLNFEESAVNIPNKGFIEYLPDGIVVEVPGLINKSGVEGIKLENYPKSFASLLLNQVSVIELTTEAILQKSKDTALQALLADPVVNNVVAAEKMLNTILDLQSPYLEYLQ